MANKLRVLAVGPIPPPYHGVATFLRDLLAYAPCERIEWLHLDTSDRRDASNLGRWDLTNLWLGITHLAKLANHCLRNKKELVYLPLSQNVPAFLRDALFILQSRLLCCRVVVHLHGGYFRTLYDRDTGPLFRAFARLALRRAAAVVVLGQEFRSIFTGLLPEDRVHVVENGVPDPGAWPLRTSQPVSARLLYMSTLTQTKGILELLSAVSLLRSTWPSAQLKVAGQWSDETTRRAALALIEREKLASHVSFVGNVEGASKAAFLADGDIFCLPTRYPYEGQPLVILEAMAAGLPVLATAHGVISATVQEGVTGRLLPKDLTAATLAQTLDEMLRNEIALRAYGEAGRRRYLEHYTLEACHQRLIAVLEKVASS
ncbi:MAG: glycosyltransferase family 4 protein [Planctomycetota bacterium]